MGTCFGDKGHRSVKFGCLGFRPKDLFSLFCQDIRMQPTLHKRRILSIEAQFVFAIVSHVFVWLREEGLMMGRKEVLGLILLVLGFDGGTLLVLEFDGGTLLVLGFDGGTLLVLGFDGGTLLVFGFDGGTLLVLGFDGGTLLVLGFDSGTLLNVPMVSEMQTKKENSILL